MSAPSVINQWPVGGLGPFTANTRYVMTLVTDGSTSTFQFIQWPVSTVLQTDGSSVIQTMGPITADTGWTANSTAGDKTAALSSYSNGLNGTMVSALNVVSGGTGTALSAAMDVLVIVVKKLAALETALVASKLPNA